MFADMKVADLISLVEALRSAPGAGAGAGAFSKQYVGKYVIVRTYASGVWCAKLVAHDEATRHAILDDARRLWYWSGAFTLSTVARQGVKSAKMPAAVDGVLVAQVEEIIPTSPEAEKNLRAVPVHEG
jgi:hypothetical protein